MIIFNGVKSDDLGVIVEHYPRVVFPEKKISSFEIPGRNGKEVIDYGVFSNYEQQYDVFFDVKKQGGLNAAIPQIASWLLGENGYLRLEDSYFPDFYREAIVVNGHEFLSYFHEYGRGTITFNCKPERYYKIGERELTVLNGETLYNPSGFRSYPIYQLNNSQSSIVLTLNENSVSRTVNISGNTHIIDVKSHTVSPNYNTNDFTDDYEKLRLGKETIITWTGGLDELHIIPNWWTI